MSNLHKLKGLLLQHDRWRREECINLIASENVSIPMADEFYLTDMKHRYAEGDPHERYYEGTNYLDELDLYVQALIKNLFKANHVELRVLSGTMANMAAFLALKKTGKYFCTRLSDGAHVSHTRFGFAGVFGFEANYLPYDHHNFEIEVDESAELINRTNPDFVVLGKSLFLFPEPLKELRAQIGNTKIIYDGAHVLGLIAGGIFQDPLREGANIITTSTHKTFPGPQGGMLLADDESDFLNIKGMVFPRLTCNWHSHRLGHLGSTALFFNRHGRDYASQIVKNAKTLAQSLYEHGFKVLAPHKGFTQSHTIAIDVSELGGGKNVSKELERNNIIVNKNALPGEKFTKEKMQNPSGIRIGTQEMTLLGMKESDMRLVADLIKNALIDKKDVKAEILSVKKGFREIAYPYE